MIIINDYNKIKDNIPQLGENLQ